MADEKSRGIVVVVVALLTSRILFSWSFVVGSRSAAAAEATKLVAFLANLAPHGYSCAKIKILMFEFEFGLL